MAAVSPVHGAAAREFSQTRLELFGKVPEAPRVTRGPGAAGLPEILLSSDGADVGLGVGCGACHGGR